MTPEASTPYDAAIADVQARIQNLQTVLDGLLKLRSQITGAPMAASSPSRQSSDAEVQHDTFFGMTIGDAAKKYLGMAKATKSTAEIAEALERGGLKHASKDFHTTVRSIIGPREDFVRVPNGDWGLTEWYPGMRKERKPKTKPQDDPKQKPKPTEIPERSASKPRRPSATKGMITPGSIKSRILEFLMMNTDSLFNADVIANGIKAEVPSVRTALLELAKAGLISRPSIGQYEYLKPVAA